MKREIIANGEQGDAGGWFKCSNCNYFIDLKGTQYYLAARLEEQKLPIICSSCDPKNGLIPLTRTEYGGIKGPLYGGDGLG